MLPRAVPASLTRGGGDKSLRDPGRGWEEQGAGSAPGTPPSLTLPGAHPAPGGAEQREILTCAIK